MEFKSSHMFFIVQQAFGEEKSWIDVETICDNILKGK